MCAGDRRAAMTEMNINWYPGHMKKTKELISENLKLVDFVIEVIDARIPISGRNPLIDDLLEGKPSLIAMNKKDLADDEACNAWIEYFGSRNINAVAVNSVTGDGVAGLLRTLEKLASGKKKARATRIMIVGVPNSGKSSLINRLAGRRATQVGDRPGVTKGKQWLTLKNDMQLLDTPGILWPKFEDPRVGMNLAFCGSIKDEIMDIETLAMELLKVLDEQYRDELRNRYGIDEALDMPEPEGEELLYDEDGHPIENNRTLNLLTAIALKRGFLMPGNKPDYERAARTVLDEFRSGKIGKITLEVPQ